MKQNELERLLPRIFQRTIMPETPLFALLKIMEALPAADEAILDQLDAYFNPYLTPDTFVPFLARWVDLERLLPEPIDQLVPEDLPSLPSGMGRLRELVAAATFLAQWRGTAKGLLRFLETATGIQGFSIEEQVVDSDGRLKPFHIRVRIPSQAEPYLALVERIVESEKPAYVTYELARIESRGDSKSSQK
ncbi:MAG TPA: phage tail protein [Ktedonobacteraceae bacterium]